MTELKRSLSVWGAASIGIGAIIGAGIFVISGVALRAHQDLNLMIFLFLFFYPVLQLF